MNLESTLQRIERKLDRLSTPKPKWVRASIIIDLTGWNAEKLRQAREAGEIEFKVEHEAKTKTGKSSYKYNLNSLHPLLIKKTA